MLKNLIKISLLVFFVVPLIVSCGGGVSGKDDIITAEKRFMIGLSNYREGDYLEAATDFRAILSVYPLSVYAAEAQLLLADTLFIDQEYEEASSYYTSFVALNPGHEKADYALYQKGMSHLRSIGSIDRDLKETRKALFAFRDLISFYEDSKYFQSATEMTTFLNLRLAEREFYIGRFYFKNKNYDGALARFRNVLKDYRDTAIIDKTLYYISESYVNLGELDLARTTYGALKNEFPDSPYISKVSRQVREN